PWALVLGACWSSLDLRVGGVWSVSGWCGLAREDQGLVSVGSPCQLDSRLRLLEGLQPRFLLRSAGLLGSFGSSAGLFSRV
ncbi:hypothetical protein OIU85_022629, partial [Salix viminalis]